MISSIRSWTPVLDSSLLSRAKRIIRAIGESLRDPSSQVDPACQKFRDRVLDDSLAGGRAGIAMLFAYLDQCFPEESYGEEARFFLEDVVDALYEELPEPTFLGGSVGMAWVLQHLERYHGAEDVLVKVDEALLELLEGGSERLNFDLAFGLAGMGIYALERMPHPNAVEIVEHVLCRLEDSALHTSQGFAWRTDPELLDPGKRMLYPDGYFNLGVAHGVPGVIAFLGLACHSAIADERVDRLLDGATNWMLAQRLDQDQATCFSYFSSSSRVPEPTRSAWCYGDPGVAAAFMCAARGADQDRWAEQALDVACRAARRRFADSGVVDAGLCHGASGLGHIFNRLYQATGEESLQTAARKWFEQTLDMRRSAEGVAGYLSWMKLTAQQREDWTVDRGLLTGAAGIALSLAAAVSPVEPEWDRCLLLSIPSTRPTG